MTYSLSELKRLSKVKKYFSGPWLEFQDREHPFLHEVHKASKPNREKYKYSNNQCLSDKIKKNEWVLDVGCGRNMFKTYHAKTYGIDLYGTYSDETIDIVYFKPTRLYDVALCLGSIQYGDRSNIHNQIRGVINALKPKARIYWRFDLYRQRKGHDIDDEYSRLGVFDWSYEEQIKFAADFEFNIDFISMDIDDRLYAEWSRE